ncbi:MAG: hypothetical protein K8T90_20940 [Planctomycetes bacterium]|nr:hypothetical protein [Planctomycetota bacterium]
MQDPDDPDAMTPEARARELAALLATGYLRHRTLSARSAGSTCVSGLDEGDRQRENEVDGLAEQSVHVPHADGSAPPAEQEART